LRRTFAYSRAIVLTYSPARHSILVRGTSLRALRFSALALRRYIMPTETHRLQEEPPEGSREKIEQELRRKEAERKKDRKERGEDKGGSSDEK
jgi:hypothetical protein